MRKIIVISMVTLDGVMQAPGGSREDESEGFKYGGWTAPCEDDASAKAWQKQMKAADLLLGRKTFEPLTIAKPCNKKSLKFKEDENHTNTNSKSRNADPTPGCGSF